mmetsp:Transcript_36793/g.112584  ORF Transcript_36793/g.112584 Transcript_36793/m.112584 type:complete len:305 (-) Transcript_36793:3385-4299(-)
MSYLGNLSLEPRAEADEAAAAAGALGLRNQDLVDEAVGDRLVGREVEVPGHVPVDRLDGLPGHHDQRLLDARVVAHVLADDEADVRGLALVRIVEARALHEVSRVGQREAPALGARAAEERAHAGGQAEVDRRHGALHRLERVVDREAGLHERAGHVEIDANLLARVLEAEVQEDRDQRVRLLLVDEVSHEHDAVAVEALVYVHEHVLALLRPRRRIRHLGHRLRHHRNRRPRGGAARRRRRPQQRPPPADVRARSRDEERDAHEWPSHDWKGERQRAALLSLQARRKLRPQRTQRDPERVDAS